MQSFGRAADVLFGPKRLKYNQKVEIETRQIQGLHAVLASSFIIGSTEFPYSPYGAAIAHDKDKGGRLACRQAYR
jgi:hypothetical protein